MREGRADKFIVLKGSTERTLRRLSWRGRLKAEDHEEGLLIDG
jgi:hypothetical protein